jgi:hypothetical protein
MSQGQVIRITVINIFNNPGYCRRIIILWHLFCFYYTEREFSRHLFIQIHQAVFLLLSLLSKEYVRWKEIEGFPAYFFKLIADLGADI